MYIRELWKDREGGKTQIHTHTYTCATRFTRSEREKEYYDKANRSRIQTDEAPPATATHTLLHASTIHACAWPVPVCMRIVYIHTEL